MIRRLFIRGIGLLTVLWLTALAPRDAEAQCTYTEQYSGTDGTTVYGSVTITDSWSEPECGGEFGYFTHYYYAEVDVSCPGPSTAFDSDESSEFQGGGTAEALAAAMIDDSGVCTVDLLAWIFCDFESEYIAEIESTTQVPAASLTVNGSTDNGQSACAVSVTREGQIASDLDANDAGSISWTFTGSAGGSVAKTGGISWDGMMVVSGTLEVTFTLGGEDLSRSCAITVNGRGWQTQPVSAQEVDNGVFATLPTPPQASGVDSGLGTYSLSWMWSILVDDIFDDGPNQGYVFHTTPDIFSVHTFRYIINPDLADSQSEFSEYQCGEAGFISWQRLHDETNRHEWDHATQSHHAFYAAALNQVANNPAVYIEPITAHLDQTSAEALANESSAGVIAIYSAVASATELEPYGVNQNAAGEFLGNINFAPYDSCP